MRKINKSTFCVFLIFLIPVLSCYREKNKPLPADEVLPEDIIELRQDQIKLAEIELGSVEMHPIGNILKVNGIISVAPQNYASVCLPSGGFVKNTTLIPGNAVSKGQILAVIDNQEFVDAQQAYLEAKNKLAFTEADFKRHNDLYKEDVYSEQNVQQVTVEFRNLKALVKSLEQKLILLGIDPAGLTEETISSRVNLLSPINGFLRKVNINIGKYMNPGEVLFEIVNNDNLYLELTLFEKDASRVAVGQKVKFYINNETEEHNAVVSQTAKSVGDDKTFIVYATVSSNCKHLMSGMYVNALISESDVNVTSLPSDAVVNFDDKDYIFTFEKEKTDTGNQFSEFRMVEVIKGSSSSGYTEIKLPVDFKVNTTKVVVKGAYSILSAKKNAGEMAC